VRFLLLDNDANFRRALAIALRLDGMTVFEAEDPQEAEKLLESQTFDAVVLHLHVPGPHLDFIARLRARLPDCRVVVCNAHQEILDAARAAGFGPVLELRRPFGAKELLERLRQ
jgi:DNA-binding response OmpR family regulator